jgi:hypothetical protein
VTSSLVVSHSDDVISCSFRQSVARFNICYN